MANTFDPSSSSSLDGIISEVDREQEKLAQNDPMADLISQVDQEDFAKTQAAARWARQYDPETYARAAKALPMAPEMAVRNLQLINDQEKLTQFQEVFRNSPQMRSYFAADPKKLPLANPDELDNLAGLSWLVEAVPQSIEHGMISYEAAMAANRIAEGRALPGDQAVVDNYKSDRTFGNPGWLGSGLVMAGQQVAPIGLGAVKAVERGLEGAVLFGGAAALAGAGAGSIVPVAGNAAGATVGAAAGASFGMTAGLAMGSLEFQQKYQTGLSRIYFSKLKDENGQSLEPELQNLAALFTGTAGSVLENISLSRMVKTLPGGGKVLGMLTKEGFSEVVKIPAVRQAMTSFAKNLFTTTGTELTTEVLQQLAQDVSEAVAKSASSQDFEQKSAGEIMEGLGQTVVQTLQVMTILGPLAAGTRFGGDMLSIQRSKRELAKVDKVLAQIGDNPLLARAPELAQTLIDNQLDNKQLYIPAQAAKELYQQQGLDIINDVAIPGWRERMEEALRIDQDVRISIGELATYIGTDPKKNPLLGLLKADPSGFTRVEIDPYLKTLEELTKSDLQLAEAKTGQTIPTVLSKPPEISFPELEQIAQQIATAGGFAPDAVKSYVTLLGTFFNTMSSKLGVSPSEYFNEFKLSIERGVFEPLKEGTISPTDFFQAAQTQNMSLPKGAISFGNGEATMRLFSGHDMTTLLHETGHFFLESLRNVQSRTPELAQDWATVSKYLELTDQGITREQHEKFARSFEAYLLKGKAPSPELRSAFQSFKRWLKNIYRSVKALGVQVSPEIAKVFDNFFVTEQRIAEVAGENEFRAIFDSAEEMGLTAEEYTAYQRLVDSVKQKGQEKALERIVGQTARLTEGWGKVLFKELVKEAETKLGKEKPYSVLKALKEGKLTLNRAEVEKALSPEAIKKLPRNAIRVKDGAPLSLAAELFGYPTVDEMLYDLTQAPTIKDAAKELATQEMVNRYGEDFTNTEVFSAVVKQQFADDARLTVLGTEIMALRRKINPQTKEEEMSPVYLAKTLAKDTVANWKIKDIDPSKHLSQVRQLANKAMAAIVKGDWQAAAELKRKQLLATAISDEVSKTYDMTHRLRNKAVRLIKGKDLQISPAYRSQIIALLANYSFAKVSKKELEGLPSLREFIEKKQAAGEALYDIPERMLRLAGTTNWRELSVEDFRDLMDTISNLEHIGRREYTENLAEEKEAHTAKVKAIVERVKATYAGKKKKKVSDNYSEKEKFGKKLASEFFASLIKPEQLIEWLDGGDIAGPMMEYIFQPIAEAQNEQNKLLLEYSSRLHKILEDMSPGNLEERVYVREVGKHFTKEQLMIVALNSGNISNLRKMTEGELFTEEQVKALHGYLTKEDWDRVSKVWRMMDSLWTRLSAMEMRLTGVSPEKVIAIPVETKYGIYEGGYYPLIYDFDTERGRNLIEDTTPEDKQLAEQQFQRNLNVLPGTSHKHTVKRTKGKGKPISLELSRLPAHVHTVIHDLAYREAVKNVRKLIWNPDVKKAITQAEGKELYEQLQLWLRGVATERSADNSWYNRAARRLRTGTTMYAMGFRIGTALAQITGFANSAVRLGSLNTLHGIYLMTTHPIRSLEMINSLSAEMRDRANMQERDIADTVRQLELGKIDKIRAAAFTHIAIADKYVAGATWLGGYKQGLDQGLSHDLAIRHADRVVRMTQGTGQLKDMASIMNSGETVKLFTMFYSFFSAQWNAQVDLTRKTKNDIMQGNVRDLFIERMPQWFFLVVLPATLGSLLSGQRPEEDESWVWWLTRKSLLYPLMGLPIVREIVGTLDSGFGYQFTPASRALEQTAKALASVLTTDDKSVEDRATSALKPAAVAASIALRVPSGQIISSTEALWKGLENDDLEASDLVYGRRGK